jgi:hypothetical protein
MLYGRPGENFPHPGLWPWKLTLTVRYTLPLPAWSLAVPVSPSEPAPGMPTVAPGSGKCTACPPAVTLRTIWCIGLPFLSTLQWKFMVGGFLQGEISAPIE